MDRLAELYGIRVTRKDSRALIGLGEIDGQPGDAGQAANVYESERHVAGPLMEKHAIGTENLIVVYDELDLPWLALRIKPKGSAAGHNGMKSRDRQFGDERFCASAIGNSSGPSVTGRQGLSAVAIQAVAEKELDGFIGYAADAVRSIIAEGVEKAMTKFNRRAPGLTEEEA